MKNRFFLLLLFLVNVQSYYPMDNSSNPRRQLFCDEEDVDAMIPEPYPQEEMQEEQLPSDSTHRELNSLKTIVSKAVAKLMFNKLDESKLEKFEKLEPYVTAIIADCIVRKFCKNFQNQIFVSPFGIPGILAHNDKSYQEGQVLTSIPKITSSPYGTFVLIHRHLTKDEAITKEHTLVNTIKKTTVDSFNDINFAFFSPQENFLYYTQITSPYTLYQYSLKTNQTKQMAGIFKKIRRNKTTAFGCLYFDKPVESLKIFRLDDDHSNNDIIIPVPSEPEHIFLSSNGQHLGFIAHKQLLLYNNANREFTKFKSNISNYVSSDDPGNIVSCVYLGDDYFMCPNETGDNLQFFSYENQQPLPSMESPTQDPTSIERPSKKAKQEETADIIRLFPKTYFRQLPDTTTQFRQSGKVNTYNTQAIGFDKDHELLIQRINNKLHLLDLSTENNEEVSQFDIQGRKEFIKTTDTSQEATERWVQGGDIANISNQYYTLMPLIDQSYTPMPLFTRNFALPYKRICTKWQLLNLETGLDAVFKGERPYLSNNGSHIVQQTGSNIVIYSTGSFLPRILKTLSLCQLCTLIKMANRQPLNELEQQSFESLSESESELSLLNKFPILSSVIKK